MSSLTFQLSLDEDRHEVSISVSSGDGEIVEGVADAADLEEIILLLGSMRSALADEVPQELEPPARVQTTYDPGWVCEPQEDLHLLCLRHPGYGWLGFALPPADAKDLGGWLRTKPAQS